MTSDQAAATLLIVMHETGTWRVRPGERFTFGRDPAATLTLPGTDLGISRTAGSLSWQHDMWWLSNDSASSMLYVTADLGFRVDLPPGMRVPVEQWHAKVRISGVAGSYTLRLRLPYLDEEPEPPPAAIESRAGAGTSTANQAPLSDSDRLVLAARFEAYLDWKHAGEPSPRTARQAAERIGWAPHTVAKRCENIRARYARRGVADLRGPRALAELAALLISAGELTAEDLRRLPPVTP